MLVLLLLPKRPPDVVGVAVVLPNKPPLVLGAPPKRLLVDVWPVAEDSLVLGVREAPPNCGVVDCVVELGWFCFPKLKVGVVEPPAEPPPNKGVLCPAPEVAVPNNDGEDVPLVDAPTLPNRPPLDPVPEPL